MGVISQQGPSGGLSWPCCFLGESLGPPDRSTGQVNRLHGTLHSSCRHSWALGLQEHQALWAWVQELQSGVSKMDTQSWEGLQAKADP